MGGPRRTLEPNAASRIQGELRRDRQERQAARSAHLFAGPGDRTGSAPNHAAATIRAPTRSDVNDMIRVTAQG